MDVLQHLTQGQMDPGGKGPAGPLQATLAEWLHDSNSDQRSSKKTPVLGILFLWPSKFPMLGFVSGISLCCPQECCRWQWSCSINISLCSAPHRLVGGFFLRTGPAALPCSGQFKWSDLCLGVSVHVWLLIHVTATGLHWSGFQVIPALIQITSQMMINCFFSRLAPAAQKQWILNVTRDEIHFPPTIRSGLPEHSRSPSLPYCVKVLAV